MSRPRHSRPKLPCVSMTLSILEFDHPLRVDEGRPSLSPTILNDRPPSRLFSGRSMPRLAARIWPVIAPDRSLQRRLARARAHGQSSGAPSRSGCAAPASAIARRGRRPPPMSATTHRPPAGNGPSLGRNASSASVPSTSRSAGAVAGGCASSPASRRRRSSNGFSSTSVRDAEPVDPAHPSRAPPQGFCRSDRHSLARPPCRDGRVLACGPIRRHSDRT